MGRFVKGVAVLASKAMVDLIYATHGSVFVKFVLYRGICGAIYIYSRRNDLITTDMKKYRR